MKKTNIEVIAPENLQAVSFSPKRVLKLLLLAMFILLLGHVAAFTEDYVRHAYSRTAKNIIRLFDFNLENNVPTWFSLLILAFAAVLLFVIYIYKKRNHIKGAFYWLALGAIFVFLSIDESVQIHEEVARILRPKLSNDVSGLLYWAWVVPYGLFVIGGGIFFMRFILGLPKFTRNLFFVSGFMFVSGALGLEFIEGYFYKNYGLNHIYNRILYCIEELLEMGAVTLFIYALLDYMAANKIQISLTAE
ncbi:MAG: multidrug transporter [Chitinophagaceae bacterium]|nr:multidrug transporter [Chitinophagaceae bacterium]